VYWNSCIQGCPYHKPEVSTKQVSEWQHSELGFRRKTSSLGSSKTLAIFLFKGVENELCRDLQINCMCSLFTCPALGWTHTDKSEGQGTSGKRLWSHHFECRFVAWRVRSRVWYRAWLDRYLAYSMCPSVKTPQVFRVAWQSTGLGRSGHPWEKLLPPEYQRGHLYSESVLREIQLNMVLLKVGSVISTP
jgi:hypothetical protein